MPGTGQHRRPRARREGVLPRLQRDGRARRPVLPKLRRETRLRCPMDYLSIPEHILNLYTTTGIAGYRISRMEESFLGLARFTHELRTVRCG